MSGTGQNGSFVMILYTCCQPMGQPILILNFWLWEQQSLAVRKKRVAKLQNKDQFVCRKERRIILVNGTTVLAWTIPLRLDHTTISCSQYSTSEVMHGDTNSICYQLGVIYVQVQSELNVKKTSPMRLISIAGTEIFSSRTKVISFTLPCHSHTKPRWSPFPPPSHCS